MPLGSYGFSIAVYAISIMIAVGGISLGLGFALNEKRMKEFGKRELYECIINGAIVGGIFLLFASGGPVTTAINQLTLTNGTSLSCSAYMSNNTAICLSYDYLASPTPYTFMGVTHYSILSQVTTAIAGIVVLNGILGMIAAVKINLVIAEFSFSYVFAPIISQLQYVVKLLSTVAISALVQAAVLQFVAVGVLTILLPAGIVLRTLYPTRKLGGFLMAASIGLYVVLPLSYVLNISLVNSYSSATSSNLAQVTLSASSLSGSVIQSGLSPLSSNSIVEGGIVGSIVSVASGFVTTLADLINQLISVIAYLIVYAFVLPAFSLIITGISIRELAGLLGSEARFGKFNIL